MTRTLLVLLILGLGCQAAQRGASRQTLSEPEALKLAVSIANVECVAKFGEAPFDESIFSIDFREGHWHWGTLDLRGVHGFSAVVSFDARGDDRYVVVFFSFDLPLLQTAPGDGEYQQ